MVRDFHFDSAVDEIDIGETDFQYLRRFCLSWTFDPESLWNGNAEKFLAILRQMPNGA